MEIKITDNKSIQYNNKSTKESKNTKSVFLKIFNNVVNESDSIRKVKVVNDPADRKKAIEEKIDALPSDNKVDVLFSIDRLNRMFKMDIIGDNGKYLEKDLTIDIPRLLLEHGDKLKSSDFESLGKYIKTLHDNGLVSDNDYFDSQNWIITKQKIFQLKVANEENKEKAIDSIFKTKKHKKFNIKS